MLEMSSGLGATAMGIGVSHGSGNDGVTSGCRLRAQSQGQSAGSSSQQSVQFQQQEKPTSGQQRQLIGRSKKDNCCLCWCCCCSCSWNKCLAAVGAGGSGASGPLGPGDSKLGHEDRPEYAEGEGGPGALGDGHGGPGGPPLLLAGDGECGEQVALEEVQSWGSSFDRLMRSPAGRNLFKEFLVSEYSDENIAFWNACEALKREAEPEKIEELARYIYEDYISIISPKEVSLDSRVRENVNRNMTRPTPHIFDEAQLQIYTLMHRDSYPRFVNSELFRRVARLDSAAGVTGSQSPSASTSNTTERREHGSTGTASVGSIRSKSKKSIA